MKSTAAAQHSHQEKKTTHHHQDHRPPVLAHLCEGGHMGPIRRSKSAEEMLMDPGLPMTPPAFGSAAKTAQFPSAEKPSASFHPPSFKNTSTAAKKSNIAITATSVHAKGHGTSNIDEMVFDSDGEDDGAHKKKSGKGKHDDSHQSNHHGHDGHGQKHHSHHSHSSAPMKSPIMAELIEGGNMRSHGSNHRMSAHDLLLDPGLPSSRSDEKKKTKK